MSTGRDICNNAAKEAMILAAGNSLNADDETDILNKANRILDGWNADDRVAYVEQFNQYVLTPKHSPHLIGPGLASPDLAATVRPVSIEDAALVITTVSPAVKIPIKVRGYRWYALQPVPTLTFANPTDLYYQPDFPNGKLYLWGIPTVAYSLELWTRGIFGSLALNTTYNFPPGYEDAFTLSLAVAICPMFGQVASPDLKEAANKARAIAFASFSPTPRLATRDSGMSSGDRNSWRWDIGRHTSSLR